MPQVAVTDYSFDSLDVERAILEPLGCEIVGRKCRTPEELIDLVADADHVITQFAPVKAPIIAAMRRAKIIVRYGIGVDNVDLAAARERGIPVCNVPDYCIDEVADHTLALLLNATRQIAPHGSLIQKGEWRLAVPVDGMRALAGATVGMVGFGRIGREVARRLLAFKCRVLVHDPVLPAAAIEQAGCEPAALDKILSDSDAITLHCPSTDQTRSAGLDVCDPEPIELDSPLRRLAQVTITPHIASVSVKAVRALREAVANTVARSVRGEPLPNVVNGVGK
jgi:D-3-phosphoglycerate dehydrogenase